MAEKNITCIICPIGCEITEEPGPWLFTPELKDRVSAFFEKLLPLYQYFNQFKV